MLDPQDILALKEIFQPQFEHLSSQVRDLKETLTTENERRRDDVSTLYDKDREVRAKISQVDASLSRSIAAVDSKMVEAISRMETKVAFSCQEIDSEAESLVATLTARVADLETRIVTLEISKVERDLAYGKRQESKRFTWSQALVAIGVVTTVGLFVVDKFISIFGHGAGK